MKFELKPHNRDVPDEELLNDLKRVANSLRKDSIESREYDKQGGRFHHSTISRRFNGWKNALEKAGLAISIQQNISDKELFENLEEVWLKLGRQPYYGEMIKPFSKFSSHPYENLYGTWGKALEAFVEYMNSGVDPNRGTEIKTNKPQPIQVKEIKVSKSKPPKEKEIVFKHKTKREPSSRLKVQVLMREGNKCRLCGITVIGDNIHFDHIEPWSKGGETTLDNIQVLCAEHNLAKGNLE